MPHGKTGKHQNRGSCLVGVSPNKLGSDGISLSNFRVCFNPGDGGLPESTDVTGWVGATPTPLTLLQINSHVQKLACRCPRGFPIMANLFRKIIVHTLSVGDRWTWPSQTCHKNRDKKIPKFSPAGWFFITERCASYLNIPRTFLN